MSRAAALLAALVLLISVVPAFRAAPASGGGLPTGSPAVLAQAGPQVERGRAAYGTACARCHGAQGQGGDGPRLVGTPNGLKEYQTAAKLFDYTKANMPVTSPGSLPDEQYWDVLAFILDGNKLLPPNITLGPDTADQVKLTP